MQVTLHAPKNPFVDLEAFIKRLERPGNAEQRKVFDAINLGFQSNFSAEGNVSGKWKPLAPRTIFQRRRDGFAGQHPILVQTGSLRASFVRRGAPDHVEEFQLTAQGWRMVAGSRHKLAFVHEFGIDPGPPRIPARPVTPFTDGAKQRIINTINYMIAQAEAATIGR